MLLYHICHTPNSASKLILNYISLLVTHTLKSQSYMILPNGNSLNIKHSILFRNAFGFCLSLLVIYSFSFHKSIVA